MILGVILVFVAYGIYSSFSAPPNLDDALCPENNSDWAGQTAIVLDPSDSLHYTQQIDARNRIVQHLETLSEYTEIRLYRLSRAGRRIAQMEFRICAPLHPDEIDWLQGLSRNRNIARQQYEEDFIEPLKRHLDEILSGPGALVSPILKTVQDVAVDAFQPPDAQFSRELVLISDMVQHSSDMSFFDDPVDFMTLANHPDYPTIRVDLEGVDVTVFLLARRGMAGRIQAGSIREFWDEYFLDQGTGTVQWIRVTG